MSQSVEIREALRQLPTLAASSGGNPPDVDDVYFPTSHVEALNPDVSLVIGNRGMGKTFWTLSLANPEVRLEIGRRYFALRKLNFDRMDVRVGFGDAEGAVGVVSSSVLAAVPADIPTDTVWRAVMLRIIAPIVEVELPKQFSRLISWVLDNPEGQQEVFRKVDQELQRRGDTILVLFDQLDQLAGSWTRIQSLTQGLIRLALAMKSYRTIKVKMFMRPDQAEDRQLFRFPDASKILNGSQILSWRAQDLYGLLYFELLKTSAGGSALLELCDQSGLATDFVHPQLKIPMVLTSNQLHQGIVFDAIAGEFMGRGSKRGRPYTWLPVHLADGRGEISPRTFLQVMKAAADWRAETEAITAVDFRGILEGVRKASGTRLAELEEDYPWVSEALGPLRGLLVPCEASEIETRWRLAQTAERIVKQFEGAKAPIELELAEEVGGNEGKTRVLLKLLLEIGVLEQRKNDKINVPDIFRVDAGILRKGGVPPQQRGRL